jgi:predicted SprT family Zn-dependent metalloprotease
MNDKNFPVPTKEFYELFQFIYDYMNERLFKNELPKCMIVITRKNQTFGYFSPESWINEKKVKSDEIAINPTLFKKFPLLEILQTVAHEMCHLWQYHFGSPSRRTYHNKEWAEKMIQIGLMPSDTGKEGGKMVGQKMGDYPIKGGLFSDLAEEILEKEYFSKLWYDRSSYVTAVSSDENGNEEESENEEGEEEEKKKTRYKYSCSCGINVWGKKDLKIICGSCGMDFEMVD